MDQPAASESTPPRERPPLPVVAGSGALGLALAVGVLGARLAVGGPFGWWGAAALLALLLTVGAVQVHRRLHPFLATSVAPAFAALLVLLVGLPPLVAGGGGRGMIAVAIFAVILVSVIRHDLRRGHEERAWGYVPLAVTAALATLGVARGFDVPLWVALATPLVVYLTARVLGLSAGARLAASVPLCLLPLFVATRARFLDGAVVAGGYDLPVARLGLSFLALGGAVTVLYLARRSATPLTLRAGRAALLWVGLPLLTLAATFQYRVHGGAVTPEEGAALSSLAAVDAGRLPFRDLAIVDGLGDQVLRPWLAAHTTGRSLRGLRLLTDLATPVDRALLVLLAVALLPPRWAVLAFLAIASGGLAAPDHGRALLPHAALMAIVLAARQSTPSLATAFLCGSAAGLAALLQPDVGSAVLIAGTLTFIGIAGRHRRQGLALAFFVPGWLLGAIEAVPWLDLSVDHGPVPHTIWLGMAAVLAGLTASVLVFRERLRIPSAWPVFALTVVCLVLLLKGPGRPTALAELGVIAVLLFALLTTEALPAFDAPAAAFAFALLIVPVRSAGAPLVELFRGFGTRTDIDITGHSLVQVAGAAERSARLGVLLPFDEAQRLAPAVSSLATAAGEGGTFFDFTDDPVLHFVTGLVPPTRLATLAHAGPLGMPQGAIVSDLERSEPALVLFRSGVDDVVDGVDRLGRYDVIASYIVRHYRPAQALGSFVLLAPTTRARNRDAAPFPELVELGGLPLARGLDLTEGALGPAIPLRAAGPDAHGPLQIDPELRLQARVVTVRMQAATTAATLRWLTVPSGTRCGVRFDVEPGVARTYVIPVAALPGWVWPREINDLELRSAAGEALRGEFAVFTR